MSLVTDINETKTDLDNSKNTDYLKANSVLTSIISSYALSCNSNLNTIFTKVLRGNGIDYWLNLSKNSNRYTKKENDYINSSNSDFYNIDKPMRPITPKQVSKVLKDFSASIQKEIREGILMMSGKDKELKRLNHVYDELLDARENSNLSLDYDCTDDINSALTSVDHAYNEVYDSKNSNFDI